MEGRFLSTAPSADGNSPPADASRAATIYLVARGERGEGQEPVAAFGSLQNARMFVADKFGVGPAMAEHGKWKATIGGNVDEVWIYRMTVQP